MTISASPDTAKEPTGKRWYVLHCKRDFELHVAVQVAKRGFPARCPVRQVRPKAKHQRLQFLRRVYRDYQRIVLKIQPLEAEPLGVPKLSGYIFVEFDAVTDKDRWPSLLYCQGVVRMLGDTAAGRPAPIPPHVMEIILGTAIEPLAPEAAAQSLWKGAQVRVLDDGTAFAERPGIVTDVKRHGRVKVYFLGDAWEVEMDAERLELVNEDERAR